MNWRCFLPALFLFCLSCQQGEVAGFQWKIPDSSEETTRAFFLIPVQNLLSISQKVFNGFDAQKLVLKMIKTPFLAMIECLPSAEMSLNQTTRMIQIILKNYMNNTSDHKHLPFFIDEFRQIIFNQTIEEEKYFFSLPCFPVGNRLIDYSDFLSITEGWWNKEVDETNFLWEQFIFLALRGSSEKLEESNFPALFEFLSYYEDSKPDVLDDDSLLKLDLKYNPCTQGNHVPTDQFIRCSENYLVSPYQITAEHQDEILQFFEIEVQKKTTEENLFDALWRLLQSTKPLEDLPYKPLRKSIFENLKLTSDKENLVELFTDVSFQNTKCPKQEFLKTRKLFKMSSETIPECFIRPHLNNEVLLVSYKILELDPRIIGKTILNLKRRLKVINFILKTNKNTKNYENIKNSLMKKLNHLNNISEKFSKKWLL